jgi:hypothetical protein
VVKPVGSERKKTPRLDGTQKKSYWKFSVPPYVYFPKHLTNFIKSVLEVGNLLKPGERGSGVSKKIFY